MNAYNLMIEKLSKGLAIVPREFAGVGKELVPSANRWMITNEDCATFQFPLDTGHALSQWYLWREVKRQCGRYPEMNFLDSQRIIIVYPVGHLFHKLTDLVSDWYHGDEYDFIYRLADTYQLDKDWIDFEVEDTPEGMALTRDVMAILGGNEYEGDAMVMESVDGFRIHIRWLEDGEPTDAAADFIDIMDRYLIDGIYNHETLMGVQEEHEVTFEGTLAQNIVNACMYTETELDRFCDQFFGKGAVEYLRQHKLNVELDWSRGRWNYVASGDMPDAEGVYIQGDDDPDMVKAWAAWLAQLYEAHVNGDVVLAAADQPRLLEV